jgi:hypothetical protein
MTYISYYYYHYGWRQPRPFELLPVGWLLIFLDFASDYHDFTRLAWIVGSNDGHLDALQEKLRRLWKC